MTFSEVAKRLNLEHKYNGNRERENRYAITPMNRNIDDVVKTCLENLKNIRF